MDCKPCQNNLPFKNANQMKNMLPENYDQQTPVKKKFKALKKLKRR